jgi:hypothetical protein
MDDLSMEAFEARAAAAEQMLAELTLKQGRLKRPGFLTAKQNEVLLLVLVARQNR